MAKSALDKRASVSPLRYPGGKATLFPLVGKIVRLNGASGGTYVEPYAGGAGIALGLLLTEQVERVVINDLDPAIYAFWRAVTEHGEEFAERLASVPITPDEWYTQKAIYRTADPSRVVELGFATFFLNRTNRSGVLNAGMIGGKDQKGNYKIDARFNRDDLLERCRLVALYASRIDVRSEDGVSVIQEFADAPSTLIYADPPYFEKGSQLYLNAFDTDDHRSLARCLNAHKDGNWILTYDMSPEIELLYKDRNQHSISIHYSVRESRNALELLVTSDRLSLPDPLRNPPRMSLAGQNSRITRNGDVTQKPALVSDSM
jgi:DNA adenine methylase